jgi:uncharacterized membrane protein YtjA (UPF0391 family)
MVPVFNAWEERLRVSVCDAQLLPKSPLALEKEFVVLYYAAVFFVIAIIAGIFGFGGIAAGAAEIARILFFIFLVIFLVSLVMGLGKRK